MSVVEGLLWFAVASAVFLAFLAFDVPDLLDHLAQRLRRQHLPHWARHGHAPPPHTVTPKHGRHARPKEVS